MLAMTVLFKLVSFLLLFAVLRAYIPEAEEDIQVSTVEVLGDEGLAPQEQEDKEIQETIDNAFRKLDVDPPPEDVELESRLEQLDTAQQVVGPIEKEKRRQKKYPSLSGTDPKPKRPFYYPDPTREPPKKQVLKFKRAQEVPRIPVKNMPGPEQQGSFNQSGVLQSPDVQNEAHDDHDDRSIWDVEIPGEAVFRSPPDITDNFSRGSTRRGKKQDSRDAPAAFRQVPKNHAKGASKQKHKNLKQQQKEESELLNQSRQTTTPSDEPTVKDAHNEFKMLLNHCIEEERKKAQLDPHDLDFMRSAGAQPFVAEEKNQNHHVLWGPNKRELVILRRFPRSESVLVGIAENSGIHVYCVEPNGMPDNSNAHEQRIVHIPSQRPNGLNLYASTRPLTREELQNLSLGGNHPLIQQLMNDPIVMATTFPKRAMLPQNYPMVRTDDMEPLPNPNDDIDKAETKRYLDARNRAMAMGFISQARTSLLSMVPKRNIPNQLWAMATMGVAAIAVAAIHVRPVFLRSRSRPPQHRLAPPQRPLPKRQ